MQLLNTLLLTALMAGTPTEVGGETTPTTPVEPTFQEVTYTREVDNFTLTITLVNETDFKATLLNNTTNETKELLGQYVVFEDILTLRVGEETFFFKIGENNILEDFEPTVEPEPEPEPPVEEDTTITFEDKDQNGIPDVFEEYWEKNIRNEKWLNISLSGLVAFGISVAPSIYTALSRRKEKKENLKIVDTLSSINEKIIKEYNEQKDKMMAEFEEKSNQIVELTNSIKAIIEELKNASNSLLNSAQFEQKIDALLNCFEVLAKEPMFVKSGLSAEIDETISEVRK